jgi:hypothetical protein
MSKKGIVHSSGTKGVCEIHRNPPVGGENHLSKKLYRTPHFAPLFSLLSLAEYGGVTMNSVQGSQKGIERYG